MPDEEDEDEIVYIILYYEGISHEIEFYFDYILDLNYY